MGKDAKGREGVLPNSVWRSDAIRYLLAPDAALGQRTAAAALKLLAESKFDHSKQDITRPIGRMLVTGAIVYDWCYPVLTAEQKKAFLAEMMKLAKQLECGYPPPKWKLDHRSLFRVDAHARYAFGGHRAL